MITPAAAAVSYRKEARFDLDQLSGQPADLYKVLILKGVLAPDEQMPSVRRLAMELSTNPNTVQRAYTELERQGFLYSVRGRGNFVRGGTDIHTQKRAELAGRLAAILKEAEDIGIDPAQLLAECGWKENTEND